MEVTPQRPHHSSPPAGPRYPATFGLEPSSYEREIPQVIRDLGDALQRFEREGGDAEVRKLFADKYSEDVIESDLALAHRRELTFDREDSQREKIARVYSLALEYIVADSSHVWFPDCSIWRSFKFDDYQRQTDLFMDVPGPKGEPLTLGLDVASGYDNTLEKISKAHDEYSQGQFHDVKYFASDTDPTRERGFALMPRLVVGGSQFGIASLARAYRTYLRAPVGQKERELQRLRFHSLAGEIYEELISQLEQAYVRIRRKAKLTPGSEHSPTHVLSARLKYLQAARKALLERYQQWEKDRNEFLRVDRDFAAGSRPLENNVLDAVRELS